MLLKWGIPNSFETYFGCLGSLERTNVPFADEVFVVRIALMLGASEDFNFADVRGAHNCAVPAPNLGTGRIEIYHLEFTLMLGVFELFQLC